MALIAAMQYLPHWEFCNPYVLKTSVVYILRDFTLELELMWKNHNGTSVWFGVVFLFESYIWL